MQEVVRAGARVLLVLIFLMTLVGQFWTVPWMAEGVAEANPEAAWLRVPGIIACVAIIMCVQVVLACIWFLLGMVARDSIFGGRAFGFVDVMIGAAAAGTVLALSALAFLWIVDMASPGVMLLLLCGAMLGAAVALIVLVMRGLLKKATTIEQDLAEVV